ncbi:MAG: hypothetical protein FWE23_07465 [Chitinivibrionia bacterium]|nr:hypothetical protein [Chitinivibrionia bacterium]
MIMSIIFIGGCSNDSDNNAHTECVWGEWVETRAATCLVGGEETSVCSVCSETRTRPTATLGHNLSDWIIITPATCMTAGEEARTCARGNCSYGENRPVAATGHNFGDLTEITVATCATAGLRARVCSDCGARTGEQQIPMLSHDLGLWDTTIVAVCGETGSRTRSCQRANCEHSITENIPELAHDLGAWDTTKVAICGGEAGSRTRACQRANCEHTITESIPVPNHTWGNLEVITPPTCAEPGLRARTCSICGATSGEQVINALTHEFGLWEITTPPECDKDGEEVRICTRENCTHSEKRPILTDCITISTAAELAAFRDQVNAGNNFLGRTVSLANDIQLSGVWVPIGRWAPLSANNRPFRGTFDGNNNVIRGIDINSSNDYQGLFGFIGAEGIVKNLGLVDVNISGEGIVGGLAGYNIGTINNCYVFGLIRSTASRAGGLVGWNNGRIENSYSEANINGTSSVGGLVGWNEGSGLIAFSYSTGTVAGTGTITGASTGGLVGFNDGRIENTYAIGNVSGSTSHWSPATGGITGTNGTHGRIINSFSTGNITGSGNLGGLVGVNNGGAGGVVNSFYNTETSERSDTGKGTPITTVQMQDRETFVNWNFTTIWGTNSTINNGFPHLRVFQ